MLKVVVRVEVRVVTEVMGREIWVWLSLWLFYVKITERVMAMVRVRVRVRVRVVDDNTLMRSQR
jgi:hypothetical protein